MVAAMGLVALTLITAALLAGCRSDLAVEFEPQVVEVWVTPEVDPRPMSTPYPTFTPGPLVATRPASMEPLPSNVSGELTGAVGVGNAGKSCAEELRDRVASYHRPVRAGDVLVLVARLREVRPDCGDQDWPVQASEVAVCRQGVGVGGVSVSVDLLDGDGKGEDGLGPSRQDVRGNILLHFTRLPGAEGDIGGCWYFQRATSTWYSQEVRPEVTAVVKRRSVDCDAELRHLLVSQENTADAGRLQGLVLEVQNGVEGCQMPSWGPMVASGGQGICGDGASVLEPGGVVRIYWSTDGLPEDGAACWLYDRSRDRWRGDVLGARMGDG